MPRKPDGEIDHPAALTGDDLIDHVNGKLFPYLAKFKTAAESSGDCVAPLLWVMYNLSAGSRSAIRRFSPPLWVQVSQR
jgi:hypothetical protein